MDLLTSILERVRFTRGYSLTLIDATPQSDWFRQPFPGVSHIAWQVGHLAMAEYGLCLAAVRGPRASDVEILPPEHKVLFGRGSVVCPEGESAPDAPAYPTADELRARLDRVHKAVLDEVPSFASLDLAAPTLIPLSVSKTKLDALRFCPEHELMHAGQIGLLRRMLGHASLR
jgi:hypothetical protein